MTRASRALLCRGSPLAGSGRSRLRRTIRYSVASLLTDYYLRSKTSKLFRNERRRSPYGLRLLSLFWAYDLRRNLSIINMPKNYSRFSRLASFSIRRSLCGPHSMQDTPAAKGAAFLPATAWRHRKCPLPDPFSPFSPSFIIRYPFLLLYFICSIDRSTIGRAKRVWRLFVC